jgi:hypothetical protein
MELKSNYRFLKAKFHRTDAFALNMQAAPDDLHSAPVTPAGLYLKWTSSLLFVNQCLPPFSGKQTKFHTNIN